MTAMDRLDDAHITLDVVQTDASDPSSCGDCAFMHLKTHISPVYTVHYTHISNKWDHKTFEIELLLSWVSLLL